MNLPKIKYGFIFNGYMWVNLLSIRALEIFKSELDNDWDYERVGSAKPSVNPTYEILALIDSEQIIVMNEIETREEAEELLMDILQHICSERR